MGNGKTYGRVGPQVLFIDPEEYYRILMKTFRRTTASFPGYGYTSDSPDYVPVEFLSTDWQSDMIAGSGSFINLRVRFGDTRRTFRGPKVEQG
jgi:hypothetical protein